MTDRISATFKHLHSQGRTALIPYVTAGFPQLDVTVTLMHAMSDAGADIIELGVPFSDPMADGPVIQKANDRALANGVTTSILFDMVREFRQDDGRTPVVLMGYANPIEAMGVQAYIEAARASGVDGLLVVDRPPEESADFARMVREAGMSPIFLVAPTSGDERIKAVAEVGSGYVYYVSLKGVTGAGHLDVDDVARHLQRIRRFIELPLGVGFGIRDAQTAAKIAEHADAVVIGTRIIQLLEEDPVDEGSQRVRNFIGDVREALDSVDQSRMDAS
ncbi:MAG: tryptophan synthase subunit alpha [Burkholderiaceae bacterium]